MKNGFVTRIAVLAIMMIIAGAVVSCSSSTKVGTGDKGGETVSSGKAEGDSSNVKKATLYTGKNEYRLFSEDESPEISVYLELPGEVLNPVLYQKDGTVVGSLEKKTAEDSTGTESNDINLYYISFPVTEAGTYKYYCTYSNSQNEETVLPSIDVQVLEEFPDTYYNSESAADETIANFCSSAEYVNADHDTRKQLLLENLWKLSNGDYREGKAYVYGDSIRYDSETDTVTFREAAGSLCVIGLTDPEPDTNADASVSSADNNEPIGSTDVESNDFMTEYSQDLQGKIVFYTHISDESDPLFVELSLEVNQGTGDNCICYSVTPTLELLRTDLAGNAMNIIECHGIIYDRDGQIPAFITVETEKNYEHDFKLQGDLNNDRVVKDYSFSERCWFYCVTPKFISYYYKENLLDGSITWLGCCHGFGDDRYNPNKKLAKAFLNCGSKAVVGHTEEVRTVYDYFILYMTLQNLVSGSTIRDALDNAESEYFDNDVDFSLHFHNLTKERRAYNILAGNNGATLGEGNAWAKYIDENYASELGYASLDSASKTVGQNWNYPSVWDKRRGILGVQVADLDNDGIDECVLYYFDTKYVYGPGGNTITNDPKTTLYAQLLTRNEKGEVVEKEKRQIFISDSISFCDAVGGILEVDGVEYVYFEINTSGYYSNVGNTMYSFFTYDGEHFRPAYAVGKTGGGSSELEYGIITFDENEQYSGVNVTSSGQEWYCADGQYSKQLLCVDGDWRGNTGEVLMNRFDPQSAMMTGLESVTEMAADTVELENGPYSSYYTYRTNDAFSQGFHYNCNGRQGSNGARAMKITVEDNTELRNYVTQSDNKAKQPEKSKKNENSEYILSFSSERYLTEGDLDPLSEWELKLARNEIYARHGRRFKDPELQAYFDSKSWYKGIYDPQDFDKNHNSDLSELEKKNAEFILKYEKDHNYFT